MHVDNIALLHHNYYKQLMITDNLIIHDLIYFALKLISRLSNNNTLCYISFIIDCQMITLYETSHNMNFISNSLSFSFVNIAEVITLHCLLFYKYIFFFTISIFFTHFSFLRRLPYYKTTKKQNILISISFCIGVISIQ